MPIDSSAELVYTLLIKLLIATIIALCVGIQTFKLWKVLKKLSKSIKLTLRTRGMSRVILDTKIDTGKRNSRVILDSSSTKDGGFTRADPDDSRSLSHRNASSLEALCLDDTKTAEGTMMYQAEAKEAKEDD
mmetsp:Transcript_11456/g.22487  ORF Transcript_11456/g.22487 Transcript_11456/m.22487 type:complete len:132 (+) Transcript_11456:4528-4923(+)